MFGDRALAVFVPVALAACGSSAPRPSAPATPTKIVTLAVLPAESQAHPAAAKAITDALSHAHISGVDRTQVSKVSLEVVQLSIECVESSPACYQLVARSLSADRILFAQIAPGPKHDEIKVTVSLFAMTDLFPHTAERVFASEQEATDKIGELLTEVAR